MIRVLRLALLLCLVADLSACTSSPSEPSGTGAIGAPAATSPANGAQIANANQPVTLIVGNASVGTASSVSYTFEVATDSGFASKVKTVTVTAGNQTTSVKLDTLPAGHDYYWHARATTSQATGNFSETSKFTIGPAVTFDPPSPVSPLAGAAISTRPTLTVTNVAHPGSGTIVYRFEIAANAAFNPVLVSDTVPEGIGQTSFTPTTDLVSNGTFFWHAQAFDPTTSTSGPFSLAQSFVTQTTIDLTTVNFQRFVNVSNWKLTDQIISVVQDGRTGDMCVYHTKSGIWPTTDFLGDPNTQVEGNQWYFANINGQWYAGAGEWLRPGQTCKSGQYTEQIGPDGTWGGPMDTWQPKPGELVGYMVTTPARSYPEFRTLDERSNIILVPWHDSRFNAAASRR